MLRCFILLLPQRLMKRLPVFGFTASTNHISLICHNSGFYYILRQNTTEFEYETLFIASEEVILMVGFQCLILVASVANRQIRWVDLSLNNSASFESTLFAGKSTCSLRQFFVVWKPKLDHVFFSFSRVLISIVFAKYFIF